MTERRAANLAAKVLAAMVNMHPKMISHSKLKLENIMIEDDGDVSILDWGFCPLYEKNEMRCQYNTVYFLAPEAVES